ncbi:MAG: trypsin-like peptidase domain-containing protein [Myxococcales bacterium]|nr:trypsin-like peptidase domain-containing protein [Myxococcales bacterium]
MIQPSRPVVPMPSSRRRAAALGLVLTMVGGAVWSQVPPAQPVAPSLATPQVAELQRFSEGFSQVAASVLPAVVSLRVEVAQEQPDEGGFPFPFFGGGRGGGGGAQIQRGTGSGVVVRSDGVIITNNHVVADARRIVVHFRDGRSLPARVLGTDPASDLAVVKVEAQNLSTARWADSERANVGEWVLAIGAPFGLEATVTQGVLSATGRAGLGMNQIEDYLQTDASINPGNSGGALVNLRGEVLGINTMILGRGSGIGFAVPSRMARMVAEQIVTRGEVTRGWMGTVVQDLSPDLATALNVPQGSGAIVSQVMPGSPGARAGLITGDILNTVDGRAIRSSHEVVREVTNTAPGARLALGLTRNGRPLTVQLTVGQRPDEQRPQRVRALDTPAAPPENRGLGLEVMQLPADRARAYGARAALIVSAIESGGMADRSGLRRGDVILQADGRAVDTPGDLLEATQDGRAALLVRRRDAQLFVPLVR